MTEHPPHPALSGSAENVIIRDHRAGEDRAGVPLAAPDSTRAYAELAAIVLNEQPLGVVLHRIVDLAAKAIPGADEVSVTMIQGGQARSIAFSGERAVTLDEEQYRDGFGPCVDAATTGRLILVEDTADNAEYPDFARQAQGHGIRRAMSVGIPARQEINGALNVYGAGAAGSFGQPAHEVAMTFAGFAAVAVLNAASSAGAREEVIQMHEAMASRAVIEQAKGIIMRERPCGADEAFDHLREISIRTRRKLRDVAQGIVDEVSP